MNTLVTPERPISQGGNWDWLVQADRVHRSVYTDEHIFSREMDHVFAGTWVYLLHESEIANPSDFRQTWIGTREVVATRDEGGEVNAFFNRCAHRGATVCREFDYRGNFD